MAPSFWNEDKYHPHFFCVFCGGPFARVFRTTIWENDGVPKTHLSDGTTNDGDFDLQVKNKLTTSDKSSSTLKSLEQGEDDLFGNALPRWPSHKAQSFLPNIHEAYDGRLIQADDMKWTKVLRALIHCDAEKHPGQGEDWQDLPDVYLTGRGRISEDASWAAAFPSIHDDLDVEEDDDEGEPFDPNLYGDRLGFHLYQEPDRRDRKFSISSTPFHEECWDIFLQALRSSRLTRGLREDDLDVSIDLAPIWTYLTDMIPVAVTGRTSDLAKEAMYSDTVSDPINRLSVGCMGRKGYREAQCCTDGRVWLHREGLHWLVANPQQTDLTHDPFAAVMTGLHNHDGSTHLKRYIKRDTLDPFWRLPPEVLLETSRYLTCSDWFSWSVASVPLNLVVLPQKTYHKFLKDDVAFLPTLIKHIEEFEEPQLFTTVDWRKLFYHISKSWRRESRLLNRRRIWAIALPMADEIVERSCQNLRHLSGISERMSRELSVVRGNVGIASGKEGLRQTLVFAEAIPLQAATEEIEDADQQDRTSPNISAKSRKLIVTPESFARALSLIHIWLHPERRYVCGLEFVFDIDIPERNFHKTMRRFFGNRTPVRESFGVEAENLISTGFTLCWSHGCLQGIQFVFENPDAAPLEYRDAEFLSPRFGSWVGPSRRLVAPRKYRTLAGISGFVASSGEIETFAIIEQKTLVVDGDVVYPPNSVPLSHHEASMWRCIPPNDVELVERQGPILGDWRTRAAECEVLTGTAIHRPPGQLREIIGFRYGDFLSGLRFLYADEDGQTVARDLGECLGGSGTCVRFADGDEISTAIIGHGDGGVHSLQLVTTSGSVGPSWGERFLGSQAIFVHDQLISSGTTRMPGDISYLRTPIIGFHCLYSAKSKRLVQLGIVTRPDSTMSRLPSNLGSEDVSPEHTPKTVSSTMIPFIATDEHNNPWVDGPPPTWMTLGRKNTDPLKVEAPSPQARYAGWISFCDPISSIAIFGSMEGIRVRYRDKDRPATCFGNTRMGLRSQTYRFIAFEKRINCMATQSTRFNNPALGNGALPHVRFLTEDQRRSSFLHIEVDSQFLAGVAFSFTAERLVDWRPLFDWDRISDEHRTDNKVSSKMTQIQNHWKPLELARMCPSVVTDRSLLGLYRVLADFFNHPIDGEADGVKGYVSNGRFCGLCFRRKGLWDEEPLGRSSPDETVFLLQAGEVFVSVYVSATANFGEGGALTLCTSFCRVTPWFGNPHSGKAIHKAAPAGRKALGIYMGYSEPDYCDSIGLLYDNATSNHLDFVFPDPPLKPNYDLRQQHPDTGLWWGTNPSALPKDYRLTPMVGLDPLTAPRPFHAFTLLDPPNLERIDAYVNTVPGRFGLKALKFRGNRRMGTTVLGDWQDKYAKPTDGRIMRLQGRYISYPRIAANPDADQSRL
ncbi:MAG: hypothetical protein M1833_000105 [Piccolia ochrophora]|nr:MAG: hypothetical protein M1833_000105 [Piccolia ochrophora]